MATLATVSNATGQVISQPIITTMPVEYHIIYKITNKKNGKIWFSRRKTTNVNDGFLSTDPTFLREYKLFGKDNFVKDILFTYTNAKDADAKETSLIQGRDQSRKLRGLSYDPWRWITPIQDSNPPSLLYIS